MSKFNEHIQNDMIGKKCIFERVNILKQLVMRTHEISICCFVMCHQVVDNASPMVETRVVDLEELRLAEQIEGVFPPRLSRVLITGK